MKLFALVYLAAAVTVSSIVFAQQKAGTLGPAPAWGVAVAGLFWPWVGAGAACFNLDICTSTTASDPK